MSADTPRRRVSLEEAASSVSVPPALRQAWNGPEPQITSSQVWRADWDHENLIVVILGTQEGIQAAPLSLDTEYADKSAVVIEEFSAMSVCARSLLHSTSRRNAPSRSGADKRR